MEQNEFRKYATKHLNMNGHEVSPFLLPGALLQRRGQQLAAQTAQRALSLPRHQEQNQAGVEEKINQCEEDEILRLLPRAEQRHRRQRNGGKRRVPHHQQHVGVERHVG